MLKAILLLTAIIASSALKLLDEKHAMSVAIHDQAQLHDMSNFQIMSHDQIYFKYKLPVDPNSYNSEQQPSPQIMKYLPLTDSNEKIIPFNKVIEVVKKQYLKAVGYNKTVDMLKARKLAQFFTTEAGQAVLTYFEGLTEHGLNYYNLRPDHYRLWLAIKILANRDIKMYARSMAEDINLFQDFYIRARDKKIVEVTGIPIPTPELLRKYKAQQTRLLKNTSVLNQQTPNAKPAVLPLATNTKATPILSKSKQTSIPSKNQPSEPKISAKTNTSKARGISAVAPPQNISRSPGTQAPKPSGVKTSKGS